MQLYEALCKKFKHFLLKRTKASVRIIWVKISETEITMEIQAG